MKKKHIISAMVLGVAMTALYACDTPVGGFVPPVDVAAAKAIVLQDVGVGEERVLFATVDREMETVDTGYYSVELQVDGVPYEYRIDLTTGEVEMVSINNQTVTTVEVPKHPSAAPDEYIGIEAAKTAAMTDAGADTEVVFTEAKLDYDNGQFLYELEFTWNGAEYDYEIVATTGVVYTKDIDHMTVIVPIAPNEDTTYIGAAAAVAAALTDAGLTADAVTVEKAEFEVDHGVHVYEVEFTSAGVEYDYEINAISGAIIEKEVDGAKVFDNVPQSDGDYIGIENAKQIALAHAGISAEDAIFEEAKLDIERGVYMYEIEFRAMAIEYEYEINATTGEVVKAEQEIDD